MQNESPLMQMRPRSAYDNVLQQRSCDGKRFYQRHWKDFVWTDCPACGGHGPQLYRKHGFDIRQCAECRTLYCSPRPTAGQLAHYYQTYDAPRMWTRLLLSTETRRKMLQYQPRVNAIVEALKHAGHHSCGIALDVGAGTGIFASCLRETGFFREVLCLDFSEACRQACQEKGFQTVDGELSDLESESVDLLCMNDLIEHVFDPRTLISQSNRILRPNGVLSIATPNALGFDFMILKEETENIVPPEHLNYFNPESIARLLTRSGFQVSSVETPGKLDVEIVRNAMVRNPALARTNEYLGELFLHADTGVLEDLQKFLSTNGLSSHMLVTAVKKERPAE